MNTKKDTKKKDSIVPTFEPSVEQQVVCDHIIAGDNVVVDACAGSGKSTTILSVAKQLPRKRFLQITYNAMLRKEFREKVEQYGMKNIEVHTYHSLAVRYFSGEAFTDTGIRHILSRHIEPREPMPAYDIVVLDETQDMTFLYFRFVLYMIRFLCGIGNRGRPHKIQLLILGDYMQGLYEFKGADIRFLTLGASIWSGLKSLRSPTFHSCSLRTSYRITRPMASFVNEIMLGEQRLLASRDGCPVVYIRNSRMNIERIVVYHIQKILQEGDLPSDIFILGASVKGANSNIRKMENALVEKGIPCHVPMLENEKIDDRVIDGKVVFSTFHTVKGRQRKYVFVIGYDQSYFHFYAKNMAPDRCPNTLYVACTRATHCMFLLESNDKSTDQPLRFLHMDHHEMKRKDYIDFKGNPQTIFYERAPQTAQETKQYQIHHVTPTDLIKFVSEPILERITPILDRIFVLESGCQGDPPVPPSDPIDDLMSEEGPGDGGSEATGVTGCDVAGHLRRPDTSEDMDKDIDSDCEEHTNTIVGSDAMAWEFSETEMPTVVPFNAGLFEDVADLNGIAVPCYYWDQYLMARNHVGDDGENTLYKFVRSMIQDMSPNEHIFLKRKFSEIDPLDCSISAYLYLANMYLAVQEKLYFKINQIDRSEYNWLSESTIEECRRRLDHHIGAQGILHHEYSLINSKAEEDHSEIDRILEDAGVCVDQETGMKKKYRFSARLDVVTESTVWEIKCTTQITIDHMLQVVIYAWLWRMVLGEKKEFRLFNLRNSSVYRLNATTEDLTKIVVELLRGKYESNVALTDQEFLEQASQISHL